MVTTTKRNIPPKNSRHDQKWPSVRVHLLSGRLSLLTGVSVLAVVCCQQCRQQPLIASSSQTMSSVGLEMQFTSSLQIESDIILSSNIFFIRSQLSLACNIMYVIQNVCTVKSFIVVIHVVLKYFLEHSMTFCAYYQPASDALICVAPSGVLHILQDKICIT